MNTLLIFFALPLATIILSAIFETFINCPFKVAGIAFSIYFSAYVCEIIKGAFLSINKTQIDSAYSLGFTKFQTFKYEPMAVYYCRNTKGINKEYDKACKILVSWKF